jgi:membrane-associated protease RseP (regulator of RpoE activity)
MANIDIFPGNAVNKPLFVVNGGRDPFYPAHVVRLTIEHLNTLGGRAVFHAFPESEHSTAWWPQARGAFEEFVLDHPREPLPDRITWETERTDRFNRAHWLIIDRLGSVGGESSLPDSNLLRRGLEHDFGLRINSRVDRGRRVSEIVAGSNAARIGLRVGDSFVEIDGSPVKDGGDIARRLQAWDLGDSVRLVVRRAGRRVALEGRFEPDEVELPPTPLFPRRKPSGRVDLVRRGNTVEASTQGVRAFTLLLSPSVFNFRQPIVVVANGRTVFDGMVEPSVATMLKWAAADDDRTMVFGVELPIDLTQ